jgi:hypothetical protein
LTNFHKIDIFQSTFSNDLVKFVYSNQQSTFNLGGGADIYSFSGEKSLGPEGNSRET